MIARLIQLFPLWAVLSSVVAYGCPPAFLPLQSAIVPLLGLVMFGMGVTLSWNHFVDVAKRPSVVGLGVLLQFLIMPAAGWTVARVFQLPPQLMAGLVLVGCCPGGTASNVICYLAKGDVALSITLTSMSTLLAVVMTPFLTWVYAGQVVAVPVGSMFLSILKIVIIPVILGVLINTYWGSRFVTVKQVFPLFSVFSIILIIAIIIALNRENMASAAATLVAGVVLHNLLGLAGGYWFSKGLGLGERDRRTIAIEVGMQNSGLGVALALQYFSPAAALPSALFSIWHNLSGSFLAGYWSRKEP